MYSITYVPDRQRLWRKFYSIAHPIFEPYKLLKILICVTFYFYGNPSLNCVSFFTSKCTSIYCKNSFFCMCKNLKKSFCQDSFRLSSFFHFCPVTTLANFCWFFTNFFVRPGKRYPIFLLPYNIQEKAVDFSWKNLVCKIN